jgi:hypothetical protein
VWHRGIEVHELPFMGQGVEEFPLAGQLTVGELRILEDVYILYFIVM